MDAMAEKESEAKAEKHDADDLVAQQKAAQAAEDAAGYAKIGVALTLVATFIAAIGTRYLITTFRETRRTAKAAIDGALAAERAALAAERANEVAAAAAKEAAEAAAEANRLNREAYVADQRPWIAALRTPGGPITWDSNGCRFSVRFVLRNTGRTPALKVDIRSKVLIRYGGDNWVKEQLQVAEGVREGYSSPIGVTIFPGSEAPVIHQILIEKNQLDEELEFSRSLFKDGKPRIFPTGVGCVDYYLSVGEDMSIENRRQTGFIFHVLRRLHGREVNGISPDDGVIPDHEIELRSWHLDGRTT
jgi:hypothetical protein